jgi:hypothetical protein
MSRSLLNFNKETLKIIDTHEQIFYIQPTNFVAPSIVGNSALGIGQQADFVSSAHCQEGQGGPVSLILFVETFVGGSSSSKQIKKKKYKTKKRKYINIKKQTINKKKNIKKKTTTTIKKKKKNTKK